MARLGMPARSAWTLAAPRRPRTDPSPELPPDRPPLSKEVLRAETDDVTLKPAEFYEENDITVLLSNGARSVDTATKTLTLADGGELGYDAWWNIAALPMEPWQAAMVLHGAEREGRVVVEVDGRPSHMERVWHESHTGATAVTVAWPRSAGPHRVTVRVEEGTLDLDGVIVWRARAPWAPWVLGGATMALVGQWSMPGGSVPTCIASGRQAVQVLCRKDKKVFSLRGAVNPPE